jgi:sugar/nucleoside kinase (ribokinase family)
LIHAPAIFSAGTVNADFSLRVDGRLERGASLIATDLLCTSGGRAANVAVMARRLGTPARLFGCVGADQLAEQALAGPRAAGVEIGAVRRVQATTGLVSIVVDGDAAKTMVFAPVRTTPSRRPMLTGVAVETAADARRAARQVRERGASHVHIRLPRGGCLTMWHDGEALVLPPSDVHVVDTTGAGDAFAGTLASRSHIQVAASRRQPRSQCASRRLLLHEPRRRDARGRGRLVLLGQATDPTHGPPPSQCACKLATL